MSSPPIEPTDPEQPAHRRTSWRDSVTRSAIRAVRRVQKGSYTAGSAVVCFSMDRREVLLLQTVYLGVWVFPGGFKDRDENPEEAAARELREEVEGLAGLELREAGLRIQDDNRHIDVVYFAEVTDELRPLGLVTTSWEISEARWVELDDALEMVNADGAAILRLALKGLELSQLPPLRSPKAEADGGDD